MNRFKFLQKNTMDSLPKTSGVYAFYSGADLIYIGKASNLKNRVKNHFNQPSYRDNLFIDKVNKIGFLGTNSEIEALILEAKLIKKYQPKYNVMWRDDKNYFYVAVLQNKNRIPYLTITHQLNPRPYTLNPIHIGPFTEGTALKKTLRFLRRVFPYYTTKIHPKVKCTYCHLDLCPGPEPNLQDYKKNIKKLVLILKGKRGAVSKSLKREMANASKNQNFEKAAKLRDQIYALQQVMAHAHVINSQAQGRPTSQNFATSDVAMTLAKIIGSKKPISKIECYDISNLQGKQATGSMVVFVNGKPDKSQYKKFKIRLPEKPNDIAMLKEILQRRFAHPEWPLPDAILIDGGKAQLNAGVNSKFQIPNSKQIQNSKSKIQNIKILALAKGRQELFIENRESPIPLKSLSREVYNLIKHLDDEAHRFAIAYHKTLRKKSLLKRVL